MTEQPETTVFPPTVRQAGDPRDTTSTWTLLPPPMGVCSQCAKDHDPDEPHDAQSLHYQYAFYAEHQRWPNWHDAMAHCDPETRMNWIDALREHGVQL